jgi:23S rRNA (uracil1939-C5)-methyltransferase
MENPLVKILSFSKKGYTTSSDVAGTIIGAIPQEKVKLLKVSGRGKNALYILEEIIEQSKDRVNPRCAHFGVCGGCSMQHVSYQRQLEEKQKKISNLYPDKVVEPIIGMDDPWHYRGKMEYTFSQNKEKEKFLGLIKVKSRGYVENLKECHIVDPWFCQTLNKVREFWIHSDLEAYNPYKDEGSLQTLTLRKALYTDSKMVILTVSGNSNFALTKKQMEAFVNLLKEDNCSIFIDVKCICKGSPTRYYEMHLSGPDFIQEKIGDKIFMFSPKSFFQPNPAVAEKFFTTIKEKLDLKGTEKVLDLFSGIGTIGMLLSPYVDHVVAVEIGKEAVCDARANIDYHEIENIEIYSDDVANFIKTRKDQFIPDIVIVDPPRSGIGKVAIDFLQELKPQKIVYLSCNPATQKEDIEGLISYEISSIHPFDQFPHTPHIENLIFLCRKN